MEADYKKGSGRVARSLALHLDPTTPLQRDIGSDRNFYKKGLGSETGTFPLYICFHPY